MTGTGESSRCIVPICPRGLYPRQRNQESPAPDPRVLWWGQTKGPLLTRRSCPNDTEGEGEVRGADPVGPPALEDSRMAGVEVGVQVAGASQFTGEHRGVQAEWPKPSALLLGTCFQQW